MFRGAAVRLAHAEALHAAGDLATAQAAIAEARDRLLAVAGTIDDPTYRRGFLEDVPVNARTLALARVARRVGGHVKKAGRHVSLPRPRANSMGYDGMVREKG